MESGSGAFCDETPTGSGGDRGTGFHPGRLGGDGCSLRRSTGQAEPEDTAGEVVMYTASYAGEHHISFAAWLFRVGRNLVVGRRRWSQGARKRASLDRESVNRLTEHQGPIEARARQARLGLALAKLTEAQLELLALKFVLGFSNGQIRWITGRSLRAVIRLQLEALRVLRGMSE